jgi:excisionase family DNA binding protein
MTTVTVEPLWGVEDVATFLRVPVPTLYQWRHRGLGPPAFKVGRHLRYDPAAVTDWLHRQGNTHAS